MVKVTPDPPTFRKALLSDNDATRRAIDHYLKAPEVPPSPNPFTVDDELSFEDALAHAAELLHCAVQRLAAGGDAFGGDVESGGGSSAGLFAAEVRTLSLR